MANLNQPAVSCSYWGGRRRFRLDFHVRGYTNREGYPAFHPPRRASWCLTFIGISTSRQDFRIIMAFPPAMAYDISMKNVVMQV